MLGDTVPMKGTKKLVFLSVLVALASALHYLELFLPNPFPVPGAKLGLANIISLVALAAFGLRDAMTVVLLRVFIGSLVGGTFLGLGFLLSLSGAVFSTLMMSLLLRYVRSLSIIGVSVAGSAVHNLSQVTAAAAITGTPYLFYYLPFLFLAAVPTGFVTGIAAKTILDRGQA